MKHCTGWGDIGRTCDGRNPLLAALRPAVLRKFETPIVQTFRFLLLVPLRPVIIFLAVTLILGRRKKHASPLREMDKRDGERAGHGHGAHPRQPRRRREFRAGEEQQLR